MIKNIIILILGALVWFAYTEEAYSANQEDQYCDIKTTLIRTVDEKGKVISEKNEETVQCDDGVKDFLFDSGIAESCRMFTWRMTLDGEIVNQRQIICDKMDGSGYEIVKGYHNLD